MIFLFLVGCETKKIPLESHPGARLYHGKVRVDVRCYRCHGHAGEGSSRAPSLVKEGKTIPHALFLKTVMEGRNQMPSFASVLSETEVTSIIDWLEHLPSPAK